MLLKNAHYENAQLFAHFEKKEIFLTVADGQAMANLKGSGNCNDWLKMNSQTLR